MSRIIWNKVGERFYETGVDRGVLFPTTADGKYVAGVGWSGLTAVNENPSGAESNPLYADNIKYLNLTSAEDFGASIEALTYPTEFAACDGSAEIATGVTISQQTRKPFGFAYRSRIGNDTLGQEYGYKIHIVYGAQAAPSQKNRTTINESPEAMTFSWEVTTTPVEVPGFKPTAHLVIDSTKVPSDKLKQLEDILYGTDGAEGSTGVEPRLLMPAEIVELVGVPAAG